MNAAIYARTSPDCPISAADQIEHLKVVAAENGWTVTNVFTDRPMPVKKGKERRPGEAALLDTIRGGSVQKIPLWSVDRVGRSLVDLVGFIETCRTAGVGLYLRNQGLDTGTSNGMSLFDLASMMAFHLRQSRRDRILRGQAAARAASVRFGRPPIAASKVEKAKVGLAAGEGVREVARLAGMSAPSVSRLKGTVAQPADPRLRRRHHRLRMHRRHDDAASHRHASRASRANSPSALLIATTISGLPPVLFKKHDRFRLASIRPVENS